MGDRIDLDAIRSRRAKLDDDPGWIADIDGHLAGGGPLYGVATPEDGWLLYGESRDVVDFVAHAPADINILFAEVDRLTAENDVLRTEIANITQAAVDGFGRTSA